MWSIARAWPRPLLEGNGLGQPIALPMTAHARVYCNGLLSSGTPPCGFPD
jgi:hypothetical protein